MLGVASLEHEHCLEHYCFLFQTLIESSLTIIASIGLPDLIFIVLYLFNTIGMRAIILHKKVIIKCNFSSILNCTNAAKHPTISYDTDSTSVKALSITSRKKFPHILVNI